MKIMLLDGNSLINRGFYALPLLTNKEGTYTNGVYGFLNIFLKLYEQETPDYVAVAFDLPQPTFRHIKFAAYKGTRKSMPEELRPQIPLLKQLLQKMTIPVYAVSGFEADDVLGTLATKAAAAGLDVVVVSGDRDLLQVAGEKVKIRIPKTKAGKTEVEDYYASDVEAIFGVTPTEYIDVKALMGDASDNIPGVPGIGEKTAFKIIQEYKTIENALTHAKEIGPKRAAENLQTFHEQAILSKELATIVRDMQIDLPQEKIQSIFTQEAYEEITRLAFTSLFAKFSQQKQEKLQEQHDGVYTCITNKEAAIVYINALQDKTLVAVQSIFLSDIFVGMSFASEAGVACFIQLEERCLWEICARFLLDVPKIMFDAKKLMVYTSRKSIPVQNIVFDALLAAYILDASKSQYSVSSIAADFLGEVCDDEEALLGKGRNKAEVASLQRDVLTHYACLQADVLLRAYAVMSRALVENEQEKLYYEIELPLVSVLRDMELAGICVNREELMEYGKEVDAELKTLTSLIYELAGVEFNINSPQQLGDILFGQLGLKGSKKTKKGYSTAADVLEKMKDKHPVVPAVLSYRAYAKLQSTYVEGLLAVIDASTGKIHSTFNQTIASTGRLSSVEPNLQNIPIRLELGRRLRKAFVPSDESFIFLDADYSQIELRVLAAMAEESVLITAFEEKQDIHRLTASQVFNTAYDDVSPAQRSNAKAVNFGIVYGIGAYSLSEDLHITKKEADLYIEGYFAKYPAVMRYLEHTILEAKQNGYAKTMFNRRRAIPELASTNFVTRSFGERVAMNMPIQGTAADIIKLAMIGVHARLQKEKLQTRLILQVHDELLLEAKRSELEVVEKILREEMENAVALRVHFEVDLHKGETWYDVK